MVIFSAFSIHFFVLIKADVVPFPTARRDPLLRRGAARDMKHPGDNNSNNAYSELPPEALAIPGTYYGPAQRDRQEAKPRNALLGRTFEQCRIQVSTGRPVTRDDLRSPVWIGRRPFYRRLAAFAAACFVGTLATDITYWRTANIMWTDFSDWLLTVGVIVGYVTVIVALIEIFAIRSPRRGRPTGWYAIGSVVALILATLDMLVHTRDAWTSVVPWGLVLSAAIVLVLILTGLMTWQTYDAAGPEVII